MKNIAAKWWKKRLDRYYLKKRWHLIADIILASIALTLLVVFIILQSLKTPSVDTGKVPHITKPDISQAQEPLSIQASVDVDSIQSGKDFDLNIRLSNSGVDDINDINLGLLLSSTKFSFSKISAAYDTEGFKISGRKASLAKLKAGENRDLTLSIGIKNLPDSSRLVTWRLNAEYQKGNETHKLQQALRDLKLVSSLNVKAAAYYNSPQGDQLGSGPLPPQVDTPTNYWVFLSPENIGNELSDFIMSATLAENVYFYDQKSLTSGSLSYNEKQRRITWTVPKLSPENGTYQAAFELQLIPSQKQVGQQALLLENLVFSAHDSYSGQTVSGQKQPLDTQLPLDLINKGKGVVKE